jgi:transcriptional regulator with XRE-family HTH domain
MSRQDDPADVRLLVMFLRSLRRWSQEELSAASGVDRSLISDYELGDKVPRPKTLRRLTAAVGLPYAFISTLLPVFRAARLTMEGRQAEGDPGESDVAASLVDGLDRAIYDAVLPRLAPFVLELESSLEESADDPEATC